MGDFGEPSGLTNFSTATSRAFTELNQNGLKFGNFTGVNVNEEGTVTAVFDNGRRKDIYQLPIAMFSNFNGLEERFRQRLPADPRIRRLPAEPSPASAVPATSRRRRSSSRPSTWPRSSRG